MKHCSKCKKVKSVTSFNRDKGRVDNLTPWCKECKSIAWQQLKAKRKLQRQRENHITLVCRFCSKEKSIKHFYDHAGSKTGYREECKSCRKQYDKERYSRNPHIFISRRMKRLYGITLFDYNLLLKQQEGRCLICRTIEPGGKKGRFAIDHDHSTKKIRGLLCSTCNRGLGLFQDNPSILRKAAEYLESYNG